MEIEEIKNKIRNEEYEIMKEQEPKEVIVMHKYGDCSFCGGEVKEKKVELA